MVYDISHLIRKGVSCYLRFFRYGRKEIYHYYYKVILWSMDWNI